MPEATLRRRGAALGASLLAFLLVGGTASATGTAAGLTGAASPLPAAEHMRLLEISLPPEPAAAAAVHRRAAYENQRSSSARAVAKSRRGAVVVSGPGLQEKTLVLPARAVPYTMRELASFRAPVVREGAGGYVIDGHVLIGPGAHLRVSAEDRRITMLSHPHRTSSLQSRHGQMTLEGAPERRLEVTSMDAGTGLPDTTEEDGRPYVTAALGRMDVRHVDASFLGFGEGRTSGFAWHGRAGLPATGVVEHSSFSHSRFGVYTFHAVGMRFLQNDFHDNTVYGFDPHDFSDRFLVKDNRAWGNGHHGFIFSRGCSDNVLIGNRAWHNGMHGFMIDDGKVADDGDARHLAAVPSLRNVLRGNQAWNNGEAGIALEGASGSVVESNSVRGNRYGIRLKNRSDDNLINANSVGGNAVYGIFVYGESAGNVLARNEVSTLATSFGGAVAHRANGPLHLVENTLTAAAGRHVVSGPGRAAQVRGDLHVLADVPEESTLMQLATYPAAWPWLLLLPVPLAMRLKWWLRRRLLRQPRHRRVTTFGVRRQQVAVPLGVVDLRDARLLTA